MAGFTAPAPAPASASASAPAASVPASAANGRAASRRSSRAAGAPPLAFSGPVARVRWDRVGRIAMLCLLVALAYLYISAGIRIYSTYRQARVDRTQLAALEHEHVRLIHQHEALARRGTVEEEARQLDMMHPDEQPYVIPNLPGN